MANDVTFHALFERSARTVRGRLALRQALTGAAIGLFVATLGSAVAWKTRHGSFRPYVAVAGAVGFLAGLAVARRRRWSDTDVALYLDEQLATEEAITTAVELRNEAELTDPARALVVTTAANALVSPHPHKARPRLLRPVHLAGPVAVVALVFLARAPLPPLPLHVEPPGVSRVQLTQVAGLEKAILLSKLDARDPEQKARLDKIAKDAEGLKRDLAQGMEKRDAQDKIARLREAIAAERLSLGDGEHRVGLESAVAKLAEHDATKRAAEALGDHDLTTMDAQMERLANEREAADRETAKHALNDAAEAARKNGAPDVAKALDEERRLTEERGKRADMLRELGEGMKAAGEESDELKSESEALDRKGTDKAARKLADSMSKALEKLTPEERKRLANKLREKAGAKGTSAGDADSLKDMADGLSTPEGQKRLEDQLKEMAKDDSESEESKRQKQLDNAQKGAAGTEGQIGKQGGGKPQQGEQGEGQGKGQGEGQGQSEGQSPGEGQDEVEGKGKGQGEGQGEGEGEGEGRTGSSAIPMPGGAAKNGVGRGGTHDTGTGSHDGRTDPVAADTLRSRAKGPLNKSAAMPGAVTTYTTGKTGGTANARGTGDLRIVGPSEVDGVERSDVPEEYRDHVRQYFQP